MFSRKFVYTAALSSIESSVGLRCVEVSMTRARLVDSDDRIPDHTAARLTGSCGGGQAAGGTHFLPPGHNSWLQSSTDLRSPANYIKHPSLTDSSLKSVFMV